MKNEIKRDSEESIFDWQHNFIEENCGLSLEIFSGELVIKGHIYNDKVEKKIYQKKLMNIFKSKFTNYNVTELCRTGKNFTMIKFENFPVLEKETKIINFEKSVKLIKDILDIYVQATEKPMSANQTTHTP